MFFSHGFCGQKIGICGDRIEVEPDYDGRLGSVPRSAEGVVASRSRKLVFVFFLFTCFSCSQPYFFFRLVCFCLFFVCFSSNSDLPAFKTIYFSFCHHAPQIECCKQWNYPQARLCQRRRRRRARKRARRIRRGRRRKQRVMTRMMTIAMITKMVMIENMVRLLMVLMTFWCMVRVGRSSTKCCTIKMELYILWLSVNHSHPHFDDRSPVFSVCSSLNLNGISPPDFVRPLHPWWRRRTLHAGACDSCMF